MRYWFDTEFIEKPGYLELISIGIVAEDGRTFYAESNEVDWSRASPWVLDNVRPHLMTNTTPDGIGFYYRSKKEIGELIRAFIGRDKPEFWGYFVERDWVLFCWLHGGMMEQPVDWPMLAYDIRQLANMMGIGRFPEQTSTEHHALHDAIWTRDCHIWIENSVRSRAHG